MRDKTRDHKFWEESIRFRTENKQYRGLVYSSYSSGAPIEEIIPHYIAFVRRQRELWTPKKLLMTYKREKIPQYTFGSYDLFLTMLSWGVLVNVADEIFNMIVDMIDKDGVVDMVLEFLIRSRYAHRSMDFGESYIGKFTLMKSLRELINQEDPELQEKLMKEYLERNWYQDRKKAGLIFTKKGNEGDSYIGYWSWESAAVTKILGLDDSSYREHEYYPKDLADYYDSQIV